MKLTLALFAAFITLGCLPSEATLYAQSLPHTFTVGWDANPAVDNVSSYDVQVDGGAPLAVTATPTPSAPITITTTGHHVISVTAKTVWLLCDDPTQCNTVAFQSGPPTTLGFTVSNGVAPRKVTNPKLTP